MNYGNSNNKSKQDKLNFRLIAATSILVNQSWIHQSDCNSFINGNEWNWRQFVWIQQIETRIDCGISSSHVWIPFSILIQFRSWFMRQIQCAKTLFAAMNPELNWEWNGIKLN